MTGQYARDQRLDVGDSKRRCGWSVISEKGGKVRRQRFGEFVPGVRGWSRSAETGGEGAYEIGKAREGFETDKKMVSAV